MKIGVPKETADGERRVALVPDVVEVAEEEREHRRARRARRRRGGRPSRLPVHRRRRRGRRRRRRLGRRRRRSASPSRPSRRSAGCSSGQVLIGHLAPLTAAETNKALAEAGVTSFAMEAIPRTTRAQAMDALSSQANVAGYAATLLAAREVGPLLPDDDHRRRHRRRRPRCWCSAPASPACRRSPRRSGSARSSPASTSAAPPGSRSPRLGGRPLELDFIPDAEGEGGYARPLTDEENEQVREALAENAARQDVIITTAAIPGRPAPLLITADAVRGMQPGSVIVDLAAESGGNCELTEAGRDRDRGRRQGDRPAQPRQRDGRRTPPSSTPRTSRTCSACWSPRRAS